MLQISKCVSGVKDCQAVHRAKKLTLFLKCEVETEAKKRRMCTDVKSHLLYTLPSQYQPDAVAVFQDFPVTTHGNVISGCPLLEVIYVVLMGGLFFFAVQTYNTLAPAVVHT